MAQKYSHFYYVYKGCATKPDRDVDCVQQKRAYTGVKGEWERTNKSMSGDNPRGGLSLTSIRIKLSLFPSLPERLRRRSMTPLLAHERLDYHNHLFKSK